MKHYFLLLILFTVGFSCSKKAVPGRGSGEKISEYYEDISALMPSVDKKVVVKEVEEEKEEVVKPKPTGVFEDDNEKVDGVMALIIENNKKFNNGQGFRIQVFSGNSKSDFESARTYVFRSYPKLEVYESYSQPTYKIKTGDFLTYQDAERYLSLLKPRFGTARIINDKIDIKKALDIK